MNIKHKVNKILIDPSKNQPVLTVEFTLNKIEEIEPFRRELTSFQNELKGQKTLK